MFRLRLTRELLKSSPAVFVLMLLLYSIGCNPIAKTNEDEGPSDADVQPVVGASLRLLVIDDPELAEVIPFEWQARMGSELQVTQMTSAEFFADTKKSLQADIVVFPGPLIGELVEGQHIVKIPTSLLTDKESDDSESDENRFAWQDVFPLVRTQECQWGKRVYMLPLGSPSLVMMVRQDILEQVDHEIPTTWDEYRQLVDALADSEVEPNRVIEPRGEGWTAKMMLARSAAYARNRQQISTLFDFQSMEPLIDSPAFERALNEMKETKVESVANPHVAANEFFAGKAAVAIGWPSNARSKESSEKPVSVTFASLPGSLDYYSRRGDEWLSRDGEASSHHVPLIGIEGRFVAVTRECKRNIAALGMARLLTGRQWSNLLGPRSKSTTLFRTSQVTHATTWVEPEAATAASEYGRVVRQSLTRPAWLFSMRIPQQHRYMQVLDETVQQSIGDGVDAKESLEKVTAEWSKITDEVGLVKQKLAYQRSLGLVD